MGVVEQRRGEILQSLAATDPTNDEQNQENLALNSLEVEKDFNTMICLLITSFSLGFRFIFMAIPFG